MTPSDIKRKRPYPKGRGEERKVIRRLDEEFN